MALALKKKQTAGELIASLQELQADIGGSDLKRLIQVTEEAIDWELHRRVKAAKRSRDGSGLPEQTIARDLVRSDCRCACALRWLAND